MLQLERLEIAGFKSFSDRTELSFPEGITAVVGPNGCGKSNLGDAINWVLGEQSPRMLRGREMADVIFSGTESRRPLGMAEVSLVFRGAEALPHDEQGRITVTRRLFRSGESEYRLNGARARLMDIQEVLRLGRVGARTYATIEQGRIDQVLNAKPKERRGLIEDAAGISGYKHKRRLAELRLDATQANLLRVHDIVQEVERQINSLKRQAARARRYRRLRDRLREAESRRFARLAFDLDREVEVAGASEAAARAAESEAAARLGRLEAEVVASRQAVEEQAAALRTLAEARHRVELEIDRAEARIRSCRERITESRATGRDQREAAERLVSQEREAAERATQLRTALDALHADHAALEAELAREQQGLARSEDEQRALRDEIEQLRRAQFERVSRAAELRNRHRSCEEAVERGRARSERLERDGVEAGLEFSRLETAAAAEQARRHGSEQEVQRLRAAAAQQEERLRELRQRHEVERTALAGEREAETSAAVRVATLEDLETRFTGASDGVKALLSARASGIRTHGVVADYVQTSRELEEAAESYLHGLLPAVILEDDGDARRAAEFLRGAGAGRTSLISRTHPAGAPAVGVAGNGGAALPPGVRGDRRVLGRLREGLKLRTTLNGAVEARIGDALLVDSLETALELHRLHPPLDYITSDGDVVFASGVISARGRPSADQGLLAHRRRLEEARVELAAAAERSTARQGEVGRRVGEIERAEAALLEGRAALEAAERRATEARIESQRAGEAATQAGRRRDVLAAELEELQRETRSQLQELAQTAQEVAAAERLGHEADQALAARGERFGRGDEELKAQVARVAELRATVAAGVQRREARANELRMFDEQLAQLRGERERLESGAGSTESRLREIAELLADTERDLGTHLAERERCATEIEHAEGEIARGRERLAELERRASTSRAEVDERREQSREAELARARVEAGRRHLDDLCRQELDCGAGEALAAVAEPQALDVERLEQEAVETRRQIDEIGPVNLTAIEEFSELDERRAFLAAQREDLERSMESLRESIRRINRESRARFEQAFEAIRRSYQEVYQLLFSGGRADLRLEQGEDVLECGIEILAQPPGKRLAGVHLLSGGEKALSAIALLFAIFRYQPSPFCLLDEVDAALDDSNVGRFTRMVAEYARNTQFLIVTHNKLTMEAARLLYGVTMEERGVSKVVSLRLQ